MRKLCILIFAVCLFGFASEMRSQDRYGGIEIGAKGIKFAAIEIQDGKVKLLDLDKQVVNATIAKLKDQKFDEAKIEDVASVVARFKAAMESDLNIPSSNIRVIASSGVPSFAVNQEDLNAAVKSATGLDLEKIGATEEAALTNLALIPAALRGEMMVVDVGSGNTKGGAFSDSSGDLKQFVSIDVPFGSSSFARRIGEEVVASGKQWKEVALGICSDEISASLNSQVKLKPVLSERSKVLFSGGAVWAMATIVKPATANEPFPRITEKDIENYLELCKKSFPDYPKVDYSTVGDAQVREVAIADYARITGVSGNPVFKPEELLAGALILNEIARELGFSNKVVYFDRKAMTAWITTKITPDVYRDQIPEAFKRVVPAAEVAIEEQGNAKVDTVTQASDVGAGETVPSIAGISAPANNAEIDSKQNGEETTTDNSVVEVEEGLEESQDSEKVAQPPLEILGDSVAIPCESWVAEECYVRQDTRCWIGPFRRWRQFSICAPVATRRWSVSESCGCCDARTATNSIASASAPSSTMPEQFRYWKNRQLSMSSTKMKLKLSTLAYAVFESEDGAIFSYPLSDLAPSEVSYIGSRSHLFRIPQLVVDNTGRHKSELALVKATSDNVLYLNRDGEILEVPSIRLSAQDVAEALRLSPELQQTRENYVSTGSDLGG